MGVNDHDIDLFEGQYEVPKGMAYNSYVIIDEKIAIMDSVDIRFADQWLKNIKRVLGERSPDYLVVQHMEPDHSSSIMRFVESFPHAVIVASARAFNMIKGFFGVDFSAKGITVGEGDKLSLGERELKFITAPMVHWPEVIVSYDATDKILFSADAFGKFGALDTEGDWTDEARRYYIGIVGKYGAQVQALLKKVSAIDVEMICPLHGPILNENIPYYLNTSVYGNTKKAAELLKSLLEEKGVKVAVSDLARCDIHKAVEDAFRYDRLVLATTTYNADIFPFMKEFIDHLTERNYQNRRVAFIENGSWAPVATKVMKGMLEKSKDLTFAKTEVKIISALNDESVNRIISLSEEFSK